MQLNLANIEYTYPSATEANIRGVTVTLPQGWTGVVGDNGSGKTTLAFVACGLPKPDTSNVLPGLVARYCYSTCKRGEFVYEPNLKDNMEPAKVLPSLYTNCRVSRGELGMGLFDPIWMTENLKKRDKAISAVQKLSDTKQLEDAAINAPLRPVAEAACARITDQESLAKVAIHAGKLWVAEQAAAKIDDPALLMKVALEAGADKGGSTAAKRIDDQSTLAQIARTAPNEYTRIAAMEKLDDLDIVAEIAYSDPNHDVSIKALDRIVDPQVIEDIARTVQDHYVRMAALEKIDSPELIRDIEASWDNEQRSATGYANMLRDSVQQLVAEKEKIAKRIAEGRCPKCGVRLTAPQGGVPDSAVAYCSNCGARVR